MRVQDGASCPPSTRSGGSVSKKMLLRVATAVAVVLSAAATALAGSQSGNDSGKGNPGKGNSGHNKDFAGLS